MTSKNLPLIRLIFLIVFAILFICTLFAFSRIEVLDTTKDQIMIYNRIARIINQTLLSTTEIEAEVSNYSLSRNPKEIQHLPVFTVTTQSNLAALSQLAQNIPEQKDNIAKAVELINRKMEFKDKIINNAAQANEIATSDERYNNNLAIKILLLEIKQNANRRLNELLPTFEKNVENAKTLLYSSLVAQVILLIVFFSTVKLVRNTK